MRGEPFVLFAFRPRSFCFSNDVEVWKKCPGSFDTLIKCLDRQCGISLDSDLGLYIRNSKSRALAEFSGFVEHISRDASTTLGFGVETLALKFAVRICAQKCLLNGRAARKIFEILCNHI